MASSMDTWSLFVFNKWKYTNSMSSIEIQDLNKIKWCDNLIIKQSLEVVKSKNIVQQLNDWNLKKP